MKRKYQLLSQKFITGYENIPFIRSNSKNEKDYIVSLEVFNTDYIQPFFESFDFSNLYALFILNQGDVFPYENFSFNSKYGVYNNSIVVVKVDPIFFGNINYNNRDEISKPFFFRSDRFESIKMDEVLGACLYERQLGIGDFKKSFFSIDSLKMLETKEIKSSINFYSNRTEASLEGILNLKEDVLDVNEDYISKIEISLHK